MARYNADLANDFGNLVSRALTMAPNTARAVLPRPSRSTTIDVGIEVLFQSEKVDWTHRLRDDRGGLRALRGDRLRGCARQVWGWIGQLNQRIVAVAPWELAKDPEPARRAGRVPLPPAGGASG